ncbi:MAG: phosphatidylserine decarboxylase family protein [Bacteroidales bacterium]|nr:phosphatidylserine decarboxylase family protein [Bacteroidales bacterium]
MSIHREGWKIIAISALVVIAIAGLVAFFTGSALARWIDASVAAFLVLFIAFFFRVPAGRVAPDDDAVVSAPSDGKVVSIAPAYAPEYFDGPCTRISIFLSIFNVHVTWYPVEGEVVYSQYHPGRFHLAFRPKASNDNEHTTIVVKSKSGVDVMFRQIAGILARRIVCYAEPGVKSGKALEAGFIKFGSRIDVFVPNDSEILVREGDKVKGITTPLARIR